MDLAEVMQRQEELLPELAQWVEESTFGPIVKHPLVIDIMPHPALTNWRYKQKQEALDKALTEQRWNHAVWLYERPYRLYGFTQIADELSDKEYWELLASIWIDSENIWQNVDEWIDLINCGRDEMEAFMDLGESAALASMPKTITVYRGAIEGVNEEGMSWTLSRQKAEWFANRFAGVHEARPVVLEGRIAKFHVAAYFMGRGEGEIVPFDPDHVEIVERQFVN